MSEPSEDIEKRAFDYALRRSTRIKRELGFEPSVDFDTGLERTVAWYLANEDWWRPLVERQYGGERLGLSGVRETAKK